MNARKPRVLLVAHHANPELNSEPLVGWQWAQALDPIADVTLITHIRNRPSIEADGSFEGRVHFVDTERLALAINKINDRLFPSAGSVNRLLLETISQLAFDKGAVRIATRLVDEGKIDVIHRVSPISPRYPTRLGQLGVPLVIGPVNGGMTMPAGFEEIAKQESQGLLKTRGLARLLDPMWRSLRSAAKILIANETTRTTLPDCVQDRTIVLSENAVDVERYEPSYERSGAELRVLSLGRLLPFKGVQFLLRAMAEASPETLIKLDIVGDGDYRTALENEVESLGLQSRVVFHGEVPQSEVPKYVRNCDILAMPSVRESGGAVVLEAMAAGKPVIVADHGGPAETVNSWVGLRLPCDNEEVLIDGLVGALEHMACNERRRERMGRAARVHVEENYTWAAKAAKAVELYRESLVDRDRAASDLEHYARRAA